MQYNTGLESNRLKAYQPLIKSLQTLSLKNRKLKRDTERVITDPLYDEIKMRALRPGFTKSPRPLRREINRSNSSCSPVMRDDGTIGTSRQKVVSFIMANKHERR